MTKKVLISLEELKSLFVKAIDMDYAEAWAEYRDIVDQDIIERWFNAQPDASLYKMETTDEVKDKNDEN